MHILTGKELREHHFLICKLEELQKIKNSLIYYRNDAEKESLNGDSLSEIDRNIEIIEKEICELSPKIEETNNLINKNISAFSDNTAKNVGKMHYIEGLPWDIIAEKLKLGTTEAIKSRFKREMQKLRICKLQKG